MSKKIKNYLIYLSITFGCIAADFITKQLAVKYLSYLKNVGGEERFVKFIPLLFDFSYIENFGAAWGMFADRRWVFMIISTVALLILLFVQFKFAQMPKFFCIPLAVIIGGGIGNMIDRVMLGYVVDFLAFGFWHDFPVFNVADICVTVGSVILAVYLIFFDKTIFADDKKVTVSDESDSE